MDTIRVGHIPLHTEHFGFSRVTDIFFCTFVSRSLEPWKCHLLTVAVAIAAGHLVYQPKISIQPRSCTQMSGNDAWVPEILIEV